MSNNLDQHNRTGISYTDLTHQDIMEKVHKKFRENDKLRNYQNSDIGIMMAELFAGMFDMLNYNIERTAEESFMSTLKRYRSAAKHAAGLAYDIQRPSPAKATITLRVTGTSTLTDAKATAESDEFISNPMLYIPKNTRLTFEGNKYLFTEDVRYKFSLSEIAKLKANGSQEISLTSEDADGAIIQILQGESKMVELKFKDFSDNFDATGNGNSYQSYFINDKSFSNFYGENDPFGSMTIVSVGETYESSIAAGNSSGIHTIHRQSLITGKEIEARSLRRAQYYLNTGPNSRTLTDAAGKPYYEDSINPYEEVFQKNVWVRTSSEVSDGQGVEIKFGDGVSTSLGCKNKDESVYVQYLSTKGSSGNSYGVIKKEMKVSTTGTESWSNYLTVTGILQSNIVGGGDIESIESIRNSAPGMFQTFDRLVTKKDYVSYLKTITSPINVKNAIAWGEQDEMANSEYHNANIDSVSKHQAIKKLFNIVLYTVVGSLYEKVTGEDDVERYRPRTNMHNAILDNYASNVMYPSQNYITIIAQQEVVKQLKLENKLLDGSVPVENFKFEIQNAPIYDSAQSSFHSFMRNVGIYKTPNYNPIKADDFKLNGSINSTVIPATISTVPFNMNVTLANKDSNTVLDLPVSYTDVLGRGLDLHTKFDTKNPTEIKSGYTPVKSDNYINTDNTAFSYLEGLITLDDIEDTETPFPMYSSTKPASVVSINEDLPKVWLHSTISKAEQDAIKTASGNKEQVNYTNYDVKITSGNDASGASRIHIDSYANTLYRGLMEGMNSANLVSKRMFGYTKSDNNEFIYELDFAAGDSNVEKAVDKIKFIEPHNFSWTPWGNVVEEVEDGLNYNIKKALNSYNVIENNSLINNFKFFDLTCNIEQHSSVEENSYLDRLIALEATTELKDEMFIKKIFKSIEAKAGDTWINNFALLNSPDIENIDGTDADESMPYIESDVYSVYVYSFMDYVTTPLEPELTFSQLEELYGIRVVKNKNDVSYDDIAVKELFELSNSILDTNGAIADLGTSLDAIDDNVAKMSKTKDDLVTTLDDISNYSSTDNVTALGEAQAATNTLQDKLNGNTNNSVLSLLESIRDGGYISDPEVPHIESAIIKINSALSLINSDNWSYVFTDDKVLVNSVSAYRFYNESYEVQRLVTSSLDDLSKITSTDIDEVPIINNANAAIENTAGALNDVINLHRVMSIVYYAKYAEFLVKGITHNTNTGAYRLHINQGNSLSNPPIEDYSSFDVLVYLPKTDNIATASIQVDIMQSMQSGVNADLSDYITAAITNITALKTETNNVITSCNTANIKAETATAATATYVAYKDLREATAIRLDGVYAIEKSDNIILKKVSTGEKVKRYIDHKPYNSGHDIPATYTDGDILTTEQIERRALRSIGWDGENSSYEGNFILSNKLARKRLAEEYKISLATDLIKRLEFVEVTYTDLSKLTKATTETRPSLVIMSNFDEDNDPATTTEIADILGNKFINLEINVYTNYAKDQALLKEMVTHVDAADKKYYTLTVESINEVINAIGIIQDKFNEYLINSYGYRSGDLYSESIQVIGNYSNLPTHFDELSQIKTAGTNYTEVEFSLEPEYSYIEPNKMLTSEFLDLTESYDIQYKEVDHVDPYAHNKDADLALSRIIDTLQEVSITAGRDASLWVPIPSETSQAFLYRADKVTTLGSSIPSWLGFENVSFTSYYETNEVNVPQNRYTDKISIANQRMKDKNLTTVKTVYLSPIFHQFALDGEINVKDLSNITDITNRINNKLYKFLDEQNDFGTPLYVSNMIEIIESFPEVINANVKLVPYNTKEALIGLNGQYFNIDAFLSKTYHPIYSVIPIANNRDKFRDIVINALERYLTKYELNTTSLAVDKHKQVPYGNQNDKSSTLHLYPSIKTPKHNEINRKHVFSYESSSLAKGVTERTFLNELCREIILKSEEEEILTVNRYLITRHKLFFMLLADIHNDFRPVIEYNMLNNNGDIDAEYAEEKLFSDGQFVKDHLRGGYSLSNEIVQVYVTANVKYKG